MVVGSMTTVAGGVTRPVGWGMVGIWGRNMNGSPFERAGVRVT
jgi:hypothetical protein